MLYWVVQQSFFALGKAAIGFLAARCYRQDWQVSRVYRSSCQARLIGSRDFLPAWRWRDVQSRSVPTSCRTAADHRHSCVNEYMLHPLDAQAILT